MLFFLYKANAYVFVSRSKLTIYNAHQEKEKIIILCTFYAKNTVWKYCCLNIQKQEENNLKIIDLVTQHKETHKQVLKNQTVTCLVELQAGIGGDLCLYVVTKELRTGTEEKPTCQGSCCLLIVAWWWWRGITSALSSEAGVAPWSSHRHTVRLQSTIKSEERQAQILKPTTEDKTNFPINDDEILMFRISTQYL